MAANQNLLSQTESVFFLMLKLYKKYGKNSPQDKNDASIISQENNNKLNRLNGPIFISSKIKFWNSEM